MGDPLSCESHREIHARKCSGHGSSGVDVDVHTSWEFLPWHRCFVHFHEQALICVAKDCGVSDAENFRLPYWDWDAVCEIPEIYGTPGSPVHIDRKHPGLDECITPTGLGSLLKPLVFEGSDGLGGGKEIPGTAYGSEPHVGIHMRIRPAMLSPDRAASDPLFYIHHANIDRFAEIWARKHNLPVFGASCDLLDTPYTFPDRPSTCSAKYRIGDILKTESLGYNYHSYKCGIRIEGNPRPLEINGAASDKYLSLNHDSISMLTRLMELRANRVSPPESSNPRRLTASTGVVYMKFDSGAVPYNHGGYSLFLESKNTGQDKLLIGTVFSFVSPNTKLVRLSATLAIAPKDLLHVGSGFRIQYKPRRKLGLGRAMYASADQISMLATVLAPD